MAREIGVPDDRADYCVPVHPVCVLRWNARRSGRTGVGNRDWNCLLGDVGSIRGAWRRRANAPTAGRMGAGCDIYFPRDVFLLEDADLTALLFYSRNTLDAVLKNSCVKTSSITLRDVGAPTTHFLLEGLKRRA